MFHQLKSRLYGPAKRIKEQAQLLGILSFYRAMRIVLPRQAVIAYRPVLMPQPEGRRPLVIAPHIDDEVLSSGGTLRLHALRGDQVTVVYMTDGGQGNPGGLTEEELIAQRKREAEASAQTLGFARCYFLGGRDQRLGQEPGIRGKLLDIARAEQPDVVYAPFPVDYHPDHIVSTALIASVLRELRASPGIALYECMAPIFPNRLHDITAVIDAKIAAVRQQRSQMLSNDYVRVVPEGLNRFRAHGLLAGQGYAEAFFWTDVNGLSRLLAAMPFAPVDGRHLRDEHPGD